LSGPLWPASLEEVMKIGLFLDVDKTLTRDFIQVVFAEELEVLDRYRDLEDGFQKGQISSAKFGTDLVELYASKGFSKTQADKLFEKVIRLRFICSSKVLKFILFQPDQIIASTHSQNVTKSLLRER
jgi:hypothetical protein